MAPGADVGVGNLRDMEGLCDLCGDHVHPNREICVAVVCTYAQCSQQVYHQDCMEKYLKGLGLDKGRKAGFPCPRGRGKGTQYPDEECRGKIDKSHPIVPKNEGRKKKAAAAAPAAAAAAAAQKLAAAKQQKPALAGGGARKGNAKNFPAACAPRPHVPAAPTPDPEPEGPHIPVGMAAEQAMNKAQRKNAKRRAKQAALGNLDALSENGSATTTITVGTEASVEQRLHGFDFQPVASRAGAQAGGAAGLTAEQIMGGHKFMDYEAFKAKFPDLLFSDSEDEDEEDEGNLDAGSDDYPEAAGSGAGAVFGAHGSGSSDGGSDDLTGDAGRPGGVAAAAGLHAGVNVTISPRGIAPASMPFHAVPAHGAAFAPAVHMAAPVAAPAAAPATYGMYAPVAPAPAGVAAAGVYGAVPAAPLPSPYAVPQPGLPFSMPSPAAPHHSTALPGSAAAAAMDAAHAGPAAVAAAAAGIPVMAAGHRAGEVARVQVMSDDSDSEDELTELLGLCGVSS